MSNELTYYERQKLEWLLKTKQGLRAIARVMRRDHSVIIRELQRNGGGNRKKYRADTAQRLWEKRKKKQRKGKLDKYPALKEYVEEKLKQDWSPEQIAGRLKDFPPPDLKSLHISHESIYYWIYEKSEKYEKWYRHLRTRRPKRQKWGKRKSKKITIQNRVSIHERPEIVNNKERYGDWESDTVEFLRKNKNPYLSVQYERKSQLVRLNKILNKSAMETKEALVKTAESVPSDIFKTITFDNGKEGARHSELKEYYPDVETFFCDPYCSWQKGGVENTNKLIRQYLPKHTSMNQITDQQIYEIQEKLNNRPRKELNYQTPNEVINKVVH